MDSPEYLIEYLEPGAPRYVSRQWSCTADTRGDCIIKFRRLHPDAIIEHLYRVHLEEIPYQECNRTDKGHS